MHNATQEEHHVALVDILEEDFNIFKMMKKFMKIENAVIEGK